MKKIELTDLKYCHKMDQSFLIISYTTLLIYINK